MAELGVDRPARLRERGTGAIGFGAPGSRGQPKDVRGHRVEPGQLGGRWLGGINRRTDQRSAKRGLLRQAHQAADKRVGQLGRPSVVGITELAIDHGARLRRVKRHLLHPGHVLVERLKDRARRDRRRLVAGDDQHGLPDVPDIGWGVQRGERGVREQQLTRPELGRCRARRGVGRTRGEEVLESGIGEHGGDRGAASIKTRCCRPLVGHHAARVEQQRRHPGCCEVFGGLPVDDAAGWSKQAARSGRAVETQRLRRPVGGIERGGQVVAEPGADERDGVDIRVRHERHPARVGESLDLREPVRRVVLAGAGSSRCRVERISPHLVAVPEVDRSLDDGGVHQPGHRGIAIGRENRCRPATRRECFGEVIAEVGAVRCPVDRSRDRPGHRDTDWRHRSVSGHPRQRGHRPTDDAATPVLAGRQDLDPRRVDPGFGQREVSGGHVE